MVVLVDVVCPGAFNVPVLVFLHRPAGRGPLRSPAKLCSWSGNQLPPSAPGCTSGRKRDPLFLRRSRNPRSGQHSPVLTRSVVRFHISRTLFKRRRGEHEAYIESNRVAGGRVRRDGGAAALCFVDVGAHDPAASLLFPVEKMSALGLERIGRR